MNTSLKIIALALAAALPGTLAIELFGGALPAGLNSMTVFAALVASLVLLTALTDYFRPVSRLQPAGPCDSAGCRRFVKDPNPLAA